ncbi:MAG: hypothetical protein Q7S79_01830 [bacterium]|nr:hypothetical protein [bacterium]
MAIPTFLQKYFWDINSKNMDPKKYPKYVMERILELGDKKAVTWLRKTFGDKKIKSSLTNIKLSSKSKNYWKQTL